MTTAAFSTLAEQHAEMIVAHADYKSYVEKCAEEHGWRDWVKDGEPAGWLYNEVLKQKNLLCNGRILLNMYRQNEVHLHKMLLLIMGLFLGIGFGLGAWLF
jgi:hypothetical protein